MTGDGFPALVDLVDRGLIRVLDLVFLTRDLAGTTTRLELADIDGDGDLDLSVFQGASSGLLGESDVSKAGSVLSLDRRRAFLCLRTDGPLPSSTPSAEVGEKW